MDNIVASHLSAIKKYVNMKLLRKARLKILVDSMYGTGDKYIEELLKGTTNKVKTINGGRNTDFGGNSPEPNDIHLAKTAKLVKKGNFDIGLATDGDSDRLGVILSSGKVITGHKVMTLLLLHLLR